MGLLGTIGGLAGSYFGGPTGGMIGGSLGGLLDGSGEENGGAGTTQKTPWGPAQPYLVDNLAKNASLQKFYEQNPFNAQQKQSYENIFSDLNNFRSKTAPGLMDFANSAMSSSYQRPQYSAPGMAGYGSRQTQQQPQRAPFSVAQSNVAAPDWNAINPHSAQNAPPAPVAQANPMGNGSLGLGDNGGNFGGYANGNGYTGSGGMFGNVNDAFNSLQGMINTPAGAGASYAASLLGLLGSMRQNPANVPVVDMSTYGNYGGGFGGSDYGGNDAHSGDSSHGTRG